MSNIIEVKNLTKKYDKLLAVDNISFSVEKGAFFAFLGPNGAGKSTTINTLISILDKTSGEIKISGHNIDEAKDIIKNKVGIVFQDSLLDPLLTVRENLFLKGSCHNLSKKEITERIDNLVEELQFKDFLDQRYGTLSGGQRRRVDIARALINDPEILFLDEPTTGLDPQTRANVWENIAKLQKEKQMTIFLTTHYMEETLNADMVAIIDYGKIVAIDTPANLRKQHSSDKLHLNLKDFKSFEENFDGQYIYKGGAVIIPIASSKDSLPIINNFNENIISFEVISGTMDDVFINITGREIR